LKYIVIRTWDKVENRTQRKTLKFYFSIYIYDKLYARRYGRLILKKWDVGTWTGLSWLRIGTVGGHL
jgi:hypothetical protein